MQKKFRKLSTSLASVVMLTSILAACSSNNNNTSESSASKSNEPANSSQSAETSSPTNSQLEPVELKWYIPAVVSNLKQDAWQAILDEANKTIKKEINATLDIVPVDWSEYDKKMSLMIASAEPYDLAFTASWTNSYTNNVSKNALAPLDEAIEKYGKSLKENIPSYLFDGFKMNGHIYAIPNASGNAAASGLYARKDIADKYGFNPSGVTKIDELEGFFDKVLAGEKGVTPTFVPSGQGMWVLWAEAFGFNQVQTGIPGYVRLNDDSLKVVNQFDTPEFRDYALMMKRWNDKGYIRKDSAIYSLNANNMINDAQAGKFATYWLGALGPSVDAIAKSQMGNKWDVVPITIYPAMPDTGYVNATSINAKSKNVDRAVMLMDLLSKDTNLYNTLLWGIEGKNYTKVADNVVKPIKDGGFGDGSLSPISDFTIGIPSNGYVQEGTDPELWNKSKEFEKSALPNPLAGFTFDPVNVNTELANVTAVIKEYYPPLDTGSAKDVDKAIAELNDKLKKAGSDKIIAEMQSQIDKWKASK